MTMCKTYFIQRERSQDYTVRATQGQNSEILATFTSRRAASAYIAKLYAKEETAS